jgi:cytochrome c peroxidase
MPDKAWADGRQLSLGYPGNLHFRNTPTLLNAAFQPLYYWDGRLGDDLPTVVRDHISEAHMMNADGRLVVERLKEMPQMVALFQQEFGGEVSYGKVLNAVAAYVSTLVSPPSPYDNYLAGDSGALSTEAQSGLKIFEGKAGCAACHGGVRLSDGEDHNLGVPTNPEIFQDPLRHIVFRRFFRMLGVPNYSNLREDPGLYALTEKDEDWGKFRTPSLREVGRTAPYMHNGMLGTLEEVVAFYNQGGGEDPNKDSLLAPLNLSASEQGALVAFLESLSSEPVAVEVPEEVQQQITVLGEN